MRSQIEFRSRANSVLTARGVTIHFGVPWGAWNGRPGRGVSDDVSVNN